MLNNFIYMAPRSTVNVEVNLNNKQSQKKVKLFKCRIKKRFLEKRSGESLNEMMFLKS